jgi:hypothetical protein
MDEHGATHRSDLQDVAPRVGADCGGRLAPDVTPALPKRQRRHRRQACHVLSEL